MFCGNLGRKCSFVSSVMPDMYVALLMRTVPGQNMDQKILTRNSESSVWKITT